MQGQRKKPPSHQQSQGTGEGGLRGSWGEAGSKDPEGEGNLWLLRGETKPQKSLKEQKK